MKVLMTRSYGYAPEYGQPLLAGNRYDLEKGVAVALITAGAAIPVVEEPTVERAVVVDPAVEKRTRRKKGAE